MNNKNGLKALAEQAKRRLSSGGKIVTSEKNNINNFQDLKKNFIYEKNMISDEEDEKLYEKLKLVLSKDVDTLYPIGQLVDQKLFQSLNSLEQDKYIIKFTEKYLQLKERFEKEKQEILSLNA